MKKILIVPVLLLANYSFAQLAPAQASLGSIAPASVAKQQAFISSLSYFAAQKFSAGEAILEQANVQVAGTASWHTESGIDLIKVAHYFENSGAPAQAYAIAKLALGHLVLADQAYSGSSPTTEVANEKEMQGQIYEHYLGDRATAEKYYSAAVALSPNSGLAAVELSRLQQLDAAEAQKREYAAGH